MDTEVLIPLEPAVVEQARAYARQTGHELSTLLATYVSELAQKSRQLPELPPAIQALRGSISLPAEADDKQALAEELAKKYTA